MAGPTAGPPAADAGPWHRRLRHSLKGRLVLVFLALALGSTGLFVSASRELFSTGWRALARPLLADYLDRLAAEIGSPPDLERAQALVRRLPIAIRIDGPALHWASHPERAGAGPRDETLRRMLSRSTADGHVIRFGLGDLHWEEPPRAFGWLTLLGLLGLTAAAYAYVRRLLRPLDDIGAGVRRYGGGDFTQAIPLRRHDELGDLAAQVNVMAGSLNRMLEGQRGLLLAISHELRSPLTRARLHAELLADGDSRDALLRDLGQMRDLIADLLESERLAAGAAVLRREPTDLNALVRALVAAQFAGRAITLDLQADLPPWPLDVARMQMLVRNLLDNALRHGEGRAVVLGTCQIDGRLQLTVRDHGPGVDEAQLARLAEPFYRPDAARTRSAGGVGLGLYLCRLVAQSHGGTLRLRHANPGLEACVQLPAAA